MKKIFSLLMAAVMLLSCIMLTACSGGQSNSTDDTQTSAKDIKVGFIFLHDENSTYDKNFMDAATAAKKALGLKDDQVMFKTNIPESNECYEAAASLVDAGCDVVFADSFGFHNPGCKRVPQHCFCTCYGNKSSHRKAS